VSLLPPLLTTALAVAAVGSGGCVSQGALPSSLPTPLERHIQLERASLTLHLAPAGHAHRKLLLLYATGDAGWRGKDRQVFDEMRSWGYTVAGFSSPEYLKHLPTDGGTATPAHVGADFARIIDAAEGQLLASRHVPVVLVGVSRGADLSVVAAGQSSLQDTLAGVVVMGLTREEEYVHRRRSRVALELYPYLPRLGQLPLSVIQSTRDSYLPASDARTLFGPDTALRKLHAIGARNHSFGGARDVLYATLRDSLAWVERLNPAAS